MPRGAPACAHLSIGHIMQKSNGSGAPPRLPETDSAQEPTAAERARAIIERQLAEKRRGPPGFYPKLASKAKGPGKGGYSPSPIRPGGRGRRG